jgi:hypothetical protein
VDHYLLGKFQRSTLLELVDGHGPFCYQS